MTITNSSAHQSTPLLAQPISRSSQKQPSQRRLRFRGEPLIVLGVVLAGWVSARATLWESPFPQVLNPIESQAKFVGGAAGEGLTVRTADGTGKDSGDFAAMASFAAPILRSPATPMPAPDQLIWRKTIVHIPAKFVEVTDQTAPSHQLLWMAAMAHLPVPAIVSSAVQDANRFSSGMEGALSVPIALQGKQRADRWSLDSWAFWRQGSGVVLSASGQLPSYGASQAGAVLRYEINPTSRARPRAYVRAYSSLQGHTEQELAAGLCARPVAKQPLRFHGEARALQSGGNTSARAAGFITTEIRPAKLPAGLTGELYGQAGYVTGTSATPFADGQAHIMREVTRFDLAGSQDTKVKFGAAAFAGAQKGAERVDIGPSVRLETSVAKTPARLSVDWRQRVAGNAEPSSGLAVTLSTRF